MGQISWGVVNEVLFSIMGLMSLLVFSGKAPLTFEAQILLHLLWFGLGNHVSFALTFYDEKSQ